MRYSRHYSDSFIGDAIGLVLFIIIFIVIILFDRVEKKKNRERCDSIKDFAEHSGLKYVESVDGFPSRYVFKFADIGRKELDEKELEVVAGGEREPGIWCLYDHFCLALFMW